MNMTQDCFPELGPDASAGRIFGTIERRRLRLTVDLLKPERLDDLSVDTLLEYVVITNFEKCISGQFAHYTVPTLSNVRPTLELLKDALARKGVVHDTWTREPVGLAIARGAELARQLLFGGDPNSRRDYFEAAGKPDPESERVAA